MKRSITWVIVIMLSISIISVFSLAGCKEEPVEETTEEAVEEVTEEAVEETTEEEVTSTEPEKKLVFGNVPFSLGDQWNGFSVENFQLAADIMGVEVVVLDPAYDGAKAVSNVEDLVTRGVDAIGVFVLTPEESDKMIEIANEGNVPIAFENTNLEKYGALAGDIIFNVYDDYFDVAYQAFKYIGENYADKKVFYVRGLPGMGIVEEFELGIEKAAEDFGVIKPEEIIRRDTQWTTETAQSAVADVIASGEQFDVIFANNESMSVGVYNALKDAGLIDEVSIVTYNGGPTGLQMLEDGIIEATVACPVSLQGLYLFKAMYLFASQGITPPEKFISLPNTLITLDNMDDVIPWASSEDLFELVGGLDSW